ELGLNVVFSVERGLMVPKSTPGDVVAKLDAACAQASKEPAFAESMKKQGTEVRYLDRKAYAEYQKKLDDLNRELARDLGLLKR
ncbi:MAG: tripartite tricarboxylate transporter substrate-binding protein, partial [candidate division NC10 bacterium]